MDPPRAEEDPVVTATLDEYEADFDPPPVPPSAARIACLGALWVLVVISGCALVVYGLGPLFEQRDQRALLESYRGATSRAANEATGLAGISVATKAPAVGTPVGVLEVGGIRLQQVVVEGVSPSQTMTGPGHVPGTAGPGQPGNSVIIGRRSAFGGTFGALGDVHKDDTVLVTTTQGPTVYKVESVREQTIVPPGDAALATTDGAGGGSSSYDADAQPADPLAGEEVDVDALYGATKDDRLTLVTSASTNPLNASKAVVVTAKLQGKPYEPTPQGGRTDDGTGLAGDASAWAPLVLSLLGFAAAAAAAVVLYRRSNARVAYLMTAAPVIVCVVLLAESASRLLPAWM